MTKHELIQHVKALEAGATGCPDSFARPCAVEIAQPENEERLRAILRTALEGIITMDERGLIESINPAVQKMFGYTAAEIVGRNVSVLMASPYREEHDRYRAHCPRPGQAKVIGIEREVVGQRKDGTGFPMDWSVTQVKLAQGRMFTAFVRDITERKQDEETLRRSRDELETWFNERTAQLAQANETLHADIAERKRLEKEVLRISEKEQHRIGQDLHDGLGQQLATIELLCQSLRSDLVLARPDLESQAAQMCRFLRETIRQTRSLAHGLAPFKLASGGLQVALAELAQNTSSLGHLECRFHCPLPVLLKDEEAAGHLYRIAQEAVHNAVKHGDPSAVTIRLVRQDGGLRLTVSDDGKGFPKVRKKSLGMGLRVMKHRANVIGADLDVESKPAKGVTVTCTLRKYE